MPGGRFEALGNELSPRGLGPGSQAFPRAVGGCERRRKLGAPADKRLQPPLLAPVAAPLGVAQLRDPLGRCGDDLLNVSV